MTIPADTPAHRRDTHARWITGRNRGGGSSVYREEWYAQQCGACWFYVPLAGDSAWTGARVRTTGPPSMAV